MHVPLKGKLLITQLHGSLRGGPAEAYTVNQNGVIYQCIGHAGIDFNAAVGTPVLAMKGGTVFVTPRDPWHGGYAAALGLYAVVVLPTGETHTYAHLSQMLAGSEDIVAQGDLLALSGATGNVTGPHLHVGVRPAHPDYGNGFDGTIDFLDRFDHEFYPLIDLSLV